MPYGLRELQLEDLLHINKWRNDHEIIDFLGNNFLYIAKDVDEAWYENYLQNRDKAKRFAIIDLNNNNIIGTTQLTSIHAVNQSAEFSILIGEKNYWNRGAGQSAMHMAIWHGFLDLNLNRIYLTVLSDNHRAIHLYEKAGFVCEGVMRQAVYKKGSFSDLLLMSLLKKNIYFKMESKNTPPLGVG